MVIEVDQSQTANSADNALELQGWDGPDFAMSALGVAALSGRQIEQVERFAEMRPLSAPPVELAGGSVRRMLAGIHLQPRCRSAITLKRENVWTR